MILSEHALKENGKQGSQICQILHILRQNCSDDSKEVTEGVTSTPEILVTNREPLRLQKFSATNTALSLPFSEQIQFMLMVNIVNLNQIIKIKELYCTTKQEEGKLQSKFTRWPPSWI